VNFHIKRQPPIKISLIQSAVLISYLTFAGLLLSNVPVVFDRFNQVLAPIMFLTFFSISALICGLAALAYPAWLIWEEKNTTEAVRVIIYTVLWLGLFFIGLGLATIY